MYRSTAARFVPVLAFLNSPRKLLNPCHCCSCLPTARANLFSWFSSRSVPNFFVNLFETVLPCPKQRKYFFSSVTCRSISKVTTHHRERIFCLLQEKIIEPIFISWSLMVYWWWNTFMYIHARAHTQLHNFTLRVLS